MVHFLIHSPVQSLFLCLSCIKHLHVPFVVGGGYSHLRIHWQVAAENIMSWTQPGSPWTSIITVRHYCRIQSYFYLIFSSRSMHIRVALSKLSVLRFPIDKKKAQT